MPEPSPSEPTTTSSDRRNLIAAVIASTVGTTIEWYDFFLYGAAAAIVFPNLFFPEADPFAGQLLSFGTFTVGFLFRPLGGIIFGHLGDRHGRKVALVATLLLMGISTLLIGLLPGYSQIGIAAPAILVLLRILQGIGVGGEWGGAILLALEYSHRSRRGYYASWPQAGVPLGLLLSTGALAACRQLMSAEAFLSWGWRLPFLLSVVLIFIGLMIRSIVAEPPVFMQAKASGQTSQLPLAEVLTNHWPEVLLAAGARISENSVFYLFATYVLAYGKDVLKVPETIPLFAVNLAAAAAFFTIPMFGVLSDMTSRKGMYLVGNGALILFAFPYFMLLETRTASGIVLATVIALAVIHASLYSVQASLIPELFGTRIRYTGASLSYQIAGPIAGGLAPLIATTLAYKFPGQYWPISLYIITIAFISSACILPIRETAGEELR